MQTPEENSLVPVSQGTMTALQRIAYMDALVEKILATPLATNWKAWFESLDAQWQKLIALHVDLMDRGMGYQKFGWGNPYTKYQEKIGQAFIYAPFDFAKIENLTYLYLRESKLSHLPAEIGQLRNLTELGLSENPNLDLADTFNKIGKLENLTYLNLDCNQLNTLPAEIGYSTRSFFSLKNKKPKFVSTKTQKWLFIMTEIIKCKISEIIEKSNLAKNLARKKLIKELILAILNCKNVQITELSLHIKTTSKSTSTARRIQAFFQKFIFDYALVAFLFCHFCLLENWICASIEPNGTLEDFNVIFC